MVTSSAAYAENKGWQLQGGKLNSSFTPERKEDHASFEGQSLRTAQYFAGKDQTRVGIGLFGAQALNTYEDSNAANHEVYKMGGISLEGLHSFGLWNWFDVNAGAGFIGAGFNRMEDGEERRQVYYGFLFRGGVAFAPKFGPLSITLGVDADMGHLKSGSDPDDSSAVLRDLSFQSTHFLAGFRVIR